MLSNDLISAAHLLKRNFVIGPTGTRRIFIWARDANAKWSMRLLEVEPSEVVKLKVPDHTQGSVI